LGQCNLPPTIETINVSISSFFANCRVWEHYGIILIQCLKGTCPALYEVAISGAKAKFTWMRTTDGAEKMEVVEVKD